MTSTGETRDYGPNPKYGREEWCADLREATKGNRFALLTQSTNFGRSKVQSYLSGAAKPNMTDMVKLAEAANMPPLRLLASAGYLPGVKDLLTYVDQLEEQADGTERLYKELPLESPTGASRIAGVLMREGSYNVSLRPTFNGTGPRRRHYTDRVVISRVDGAAMRKPDRDHIEKLVRSELAWFGAGFIDGWSNETEIAVNVPRFVSIRRGTGTPQASAPRTIAVVGGHWAGSADVASFLGYALDYGYDHVAFVASRAFSRLTHKWRDSQREVDRLEVAKTYVAGSDIGRHRVWAADVGDSADVIKTVARTESETTPFLIYLRPKDDLLRWTARARYQWGHTDDSFQEGYTKLAHTRRQVDDTMTLLIPEAKRLTLDVGLPDPAPVDGQDRPVDDQDGFFDLWFSLAEAAVRAMAEKEAAPHAEIHKRHKVLPEVALEAMLARMSDISLQR